MSRPPLELPIGNPTSTTNVVSLRSHVSQLININKIDTLLTSLSAILISKSTSCIVFLYTKQFKVIRSRKNLQNELGNHNIVYSAHTGGLTFLRISSTTSCGVIRFISSLTSSGSLPH